MSKTIKKDDYEYSIRATFAKKIPFCIVYIKIKTSEKDLLFSLNNKFKVEKLLYAGCNGLNGIMKVVCGTNGIVISCPENKITSVIQQYISYLSKTELKPKQLFGEKGNYNDLEKGLKHVEIHIVGKCKTFIKNCLGKEESNKIKNMMAGIVGRNVKERKPVQNDKYNKNLEEKEIKCTESQAVDYVIACRDKNIKINYGSGKLTVKFIGCCPNCGSCCCGCCYTDTVRAYLKSFKTQCGNGSDADVTFDCINQIAWCYTDCRGYGLKYKNKEELKTVDSESVKLINH